MHGKKIDGRRVLVDVERARTVKGWLPRRLGGGLGGTRRGGPDVNVRHAGREEHRDRDGRRDDRGGRRRSRSRDRKRSRSRDRRRDRDRGDRGGKTEDDWKVRIKNEPDDGEYYRQENNDYGGFNAQIKTEQEEDRKPFSANNGDY